MLVVAVVVGTGVAPSGAQQPLPGDNSGAWQYIEPVPDAAGDRPAAPGRGGSAQALSPGARSALPPGREGRTLERLASDPGSGAPRQGRQSARTPPEGEVGAASGFTSAVLDSDSRAVTVVLLAMLGMTLVGAVVRLTRQP